MRSTAAAALIVATWSSFGCGASGPVGPVVREHHVVERGAATSARVDIDMSAGELAVNSGSTTLLEGDFDFNVPSLKPVIKYAVDGTTGALNVSQGSASGNYENRWRLTLNETTPVELRVTLGAGDVELALGRVNLQSLSVRLGAGDLMLDLRGTPSKSFSVTVQAGTGDTTIRLPATVGISASTSGLIGDSNVSGLEKRNGRWVNPQAEASPVVVNVSVQHAIGDLKLIAE